MIETIVVHSDQGRELCPHYYLLLLFSNASPQTSKEAECLSLLLK